MWRGWLMVLALALPLVVQAQTPDIDELQHKLDRLRAEKAVKDKKAAAEKKASEAAAEKAAADKALADKVAADKAAADKAVADQAAAAAAAKAAADMATARQAATQSARAHEATDMVVIRSGRLLMGYAENQPGRPIGEGPKHSVSIRSFALAKYDVTFEEWDLCVAAGGCNGYRPDDEHMGRGNRPVINVNYDDALAYARWYSLMTGHDYRLPTEAEWEYAARAGTTTIFYWGDTVGSGHAVCGNCGTQWGGVSTAPVGSLAPNGWGLYDMAGNVNQWTQDCWNISYFDAPTDGRAWTSGDCTEHVTRGGNWMFDADEAASAYRMGTALKTDERNLGLGFRLARTLP